MVIRVAGVVGGLAALLAGLHYYVDSVTLSLGMFATGVGGLSLIAVVGILMLIVIFGERMAQSDDVDGSLLAEWSLYIKTAGAVLFVGVVVYWLSLEGAMDAARSFWWVLPLLVGGYVLFLYMGHRRNVASASTAIDRTQRSIQRNVSSRMEAAAGTVVLGFALAAAIVSGLFAGMSGLGDVLLMFAGEATYLVAVVVGYVQIGGELPYLGWVIPELSPRQWVAATLLLGALAIMVRDPR